MTAVEAAREEGVIRHQWFWDAVVGGFAFGALAAIVTGIIALTAVTLIVFDNGIEPRDFERGVQLLSIPWVVTWLLFIWHAWHEHRKSTSESP